MMQEIDKSNVKLCLDLPLFYDRQSDEYIHEAIEHCGKHTILTHFGSWNFSQKADGEIVEDPSPSFGGQTNYKTFFNLLLEAGYEGYLVSEYCLPALKNHQVAGIEEIDKGTRLSLKYMKDLLKVPSAAQTKKHAII